MINLPDSPVMKKGVINWILGDYKITKRRRMPRKTIKPWMRSRTLWVAVVTMVTGLGMYFTGDQTVDDLLIVVIGAVFAYLRTITTERIR